MALRVIAHRGARTEAPENTLSAFRLAVDAGADMIEFDVQLSQDGHVVVMHDPSLDRMTDMAGLIAQLPWSELARATVGGPKWPGSKERIPLLHEVLAVACEGNIAVNIELKPAGDNYRRLADAVVAQVRRCGFPAEAVLISCFNWDALRYIAQAYPEYRLAALYKTRPADPLALPGTVIHPEFATVDAGFIAAAHAAGKQVNVWALNRPDEWERAIELGADGITTDEPRLLRRFLRERQAVGGARA